MRHDHHLQLVRMAAGLVVHGGPAMNFLYNLYWETLMILMYLFPLLIALVRATAIVAAAGAIVLLITPLLIS